MIYQNILMFIASLCALFFNVLTYVKNRTSKVNRNFALFGICIFVWLFMFAIAYTVNNPSAKIFWFRVGYVGIIFIPVTFFSFVYHLLEIKRFSIILKINYFCGLLFLIHHLFVQSLVIGVYRFSWGIYPNTSTWSHYVFLSFLLLLFGAGMMLMFLYLLKDKSGNLIQSMRIKYVLSGSIVGSLACVDFFGSYGVNFPPIGFVFMFLYPVIFSYAILKYRLMDVSLVITRTTVFIVVYSFVLGIPFALAFGLRAKLSNMFGEWWWMAPLVTSTILATVGPFIYLYIQKRAEDQLFQEQRRYQATLRQASTGMGKIKDLRKLVTLIVHIMTRTVRVEYSMVFLSDAHAKIFRLGAHRSRQAKSKYRGDISYDTALVKTLIETQNPIVYEEIKQRAQDYGDFKLARLESELKALDAALVVPSFVDEKLLAILVMGSKISGKIYSSDDLAVFSILANQSALAIENAQFYEDMKLTTAQLMKAEKMATIGIMADGLSHQINNRLHAMGFIAGDALDTLKIKNNLPMSLEVKEVMLDMEHALNRIESNVQQGGEIVQGLLKYTRKGEEGMTQVALDKLVAAALEMTQFKIKPGELIVNQDFSKDVPKIHGNFTQLQEVFFNMIDNAYDAMMQRKSELKEPNYAPTIKITAKAGTSRNLEIVFEDNGIGIRDEDKEKIFTPFFTTKLSSKKGTGLGLYVIQRLIEENHKGTVKYESKFKQGTKVYISLPT